MGVKRSEAEVLGHDTTLHAAIDELTRGRRGADPLHGDANSDQPKPEPAHDREKLYRYGEHTVPPDVLMAMAAVDLAAVDEQGACPSKPTDAPPQELPSRKRWPVLLVFTALIIVGVAAWSLGSRRGRRDASLPAATSASPALSSAPVTVATSAPPVRFAPPHSAPTQSAAASASESASVPTTARPTKRNTPPAPQTAAPPPPDPQYEPDRPLL